MDPYADKTASCQIIKKILFNNLIWKTEMGRCLVRYIQRHKNDSDLPSSGSTISSHHCLQDAYWKQVRIRSGAMTQTQAAELEMWVFQTMSTTVANAHVCCWFFFSSVCILDTNQLSNEYFSNISPYSSGLFLQLLDST